MNKFGAFLLIVIFLIVLGGLLALVRFMGGEDSWIKDSRGVWIRHGNPALTPDYVIKQQMIIECAKNLLEEKSKAENISSQCLGTCSDYSVDVVHVPRQTEDNFKENQCSEYLEGITTHFIELNNKEEIVKVA